MPDDAQPYFYDAFISYRHVDRDRKWAEWLIDALERYRIPKALQDKGLPPRLHKVFRDEDEVPASSDLNDQIREALIASRFLIVVCSAFTPRSKWVEREIQIFNELGRGDQVLALLTEGEPGDSFPAAMLERHREVTDHDGSKRIVKEDKEPLAADVRPRPGVSNEKLKRFALLRLVAVILGVKFDELRQRDHERERHGRLVWGAAAAVICVLLAGLGLLYWDMMRPSTAHFRQIVWRWGVPEGLGPIDEVTRRHLVTNYSVTTQRSGIWAAPRVAEARRENSAGKLRDLNSQRNDNDERVHWVIRYREDGSVERIEGFDATDRLLREDVLRSEPSSNRIIVVFERDNIPVAQNANQNMVIDPLNVARSNLTEGRTEITRQDLTFDSNGFVVERRFQDNWGKPRHDAEGSFGEHFANSPEGLVVRTAEIDAAGTEITLKNGVRAVEALYDRDYKLARYTLIGSDERPIDGPNGFTYYVRQFDRWGNDLRTNYYHPDGTTALVRDGYTAYVAPRDDRGFLTSLTYLGLDGKPTLHKNGYASDQRLYDDRGYPIEDSFFSVDGKPTLIKSGYSKIKRRYDAHGHLSEEAYFDIDGMPTLLNYGEAIVRQTFDQRGNLTEQSFFGVDGKPTLTKDGYSSARQAFDERGNRVELDYFGADGNPILNNAGIAEITYTFDARGNEIKREFFGVDGKPRLINTGYAGFHQAFDERGNLIEQDYFGVDGKMIPTTDGFFARKTRDYGSRGNLIQETYFGVDGKPTLQANLLIAKFTAAYDSRGNRIEEANFGVDGKRTLTRNGIAIFRQAFDSRGNVTEVSCFGVDGKPTLVADHYAGYRQAFDARGNKIEQIYFGLDGKPTLDKNGIARITYVYDARGNATEAVYFGLDGKPTLNTEGYARTAYEYNHLGREIDARYLDLKSREISMEVVVQDVFRGSPAERIGLKTEDRILSYDGKVPTSVKQLVDLITDATGDATRLLVVRRGPDVLTFDVGSGRLGILIDLARADTASITPAGGHPVLPPVVQAPARE